MTVGGIVVECKKIRTKSGSQMMFATLDDVEGQMEMLVFKADEAESAQVIAPDAIVIVRGRIDHKDRGETKLVVQEAQRFEPDAAEVERAPRTPRRRDHRAGAAAATIAAAKASTRPGRGAEGAVLEHHKGESDVHLAIRRPRVARRRSGLRRRVPGAALAEPSARDRATARRRRPGGLIPSARPPRRLH